MQHAFKLPVGFSDHTLGIHISIAAVAMGASIIEKHFTLDRGLPGPDHSFSVEPDELKKMVHCIREVEMAQGNGIKEKSELENEEMYSKARRSIHAKTDIKKGTIITRDVLTIKRPGYGIKPKFIDITRDVLTIKRPGYGIKPKFIDIVVGRKAKEDIIEDEWITWGKV
jgi:N-acetylneuraminate synthase/N,N'-diacetyllegionaminate synthase